MWPLYEVRPRKRADFAVTLYEGAEQRVPTH